MRNNQKKDRCFFFWRGKAINEREEDEMAHKAQDVRLDEKNELVTMEGTVKDMRKIYSNVIISKELELLGLINDKTQT